MGAPGLRFMPGLSDGDTVEAKKRAEWRRGNGSRSEAPQFLSGNVRANDKSSGSFGQRNSEVHKCPQVNLGLHSSNLKLYPEKSCSQYLKKLPTVTTQPFLTQAPWAFSADGWSASGASR